MILRQGPETCEVVVKLSCQLLSLLGMHSPHCAACNIQRANGENIRKRLEELNDQTQLHSSNVGDQAAKIVRSPIALKGKQRKKEIA